MFGGVSRTIPFAIRFGKGGFPNAPLPANNWLVKVAMFFKVSATIWRLSGALSTESLVTALDSQFTYTEPARNEPDRQNGPVVSSAMEDCNELLELAAQGGIQFVRATEDGRYEVMNHSSSIPNIFQILSYIYIYVYTFVYVCNEIGFLVKRERFLYIGPRFIDYFITYILM